MKRVAIMTALALALSIPALSQTASAATYAIGHMAQNYYAGGRTLSTIEMRQLFNQLKEKAGGLYAKYAGQIQQQSRTIDTTQLLNLVRNQ